MGKCKISGGNNPPENWGLHMAYSLLLVAKILPLHP
jgi:hypothetical protein